MKKSLLVLFLAVSFSSLARVQQDTITSRLESPYEALQTFVTNTEGEEENLSAASILFNNYKMKTEEKIEYTKKLEQILEGAGIYIFFDKVPKEQDYFDSLTNEHRYAFMEEYPDVFLLRKNGRWQIQPPEMAQIDTVHKKLFKFGTDFILSEEAKEDKLGAYFLGLKIWQWIGIVAIFVFSYLVRALFSLVFEKLIVRVLDKVSHREVGNRYILPVAKPIGTMAVFLSLAVVYPMLQLPKEVGYYVMLAIKGLVPFFGMIAFLRLINIVEIFMLRWVSKTESSLDDQLVPLLKRILRICVVIVGGLLILDNLSIPILPLLTGLSIGGLAFALAAQDTIKNFFGSLMIFVDKPFQIGDWITTGEIDGTVEEVGFRSTRIRTFRNSLIYIPNGQLADSTIDNNGLRQYRRFKTTLAIKYDTPPERIEVFVEGLKKIHNVHPNTHKDRFEIHLNDMGASSLDILFYIFFEAPTWSDELKFRQEIILEILKLGRLLSVHFAFPTQTLHVEDLPGQLSLSPEYTLTKKDLNERLDKYFMEKQDVEGGK
ncbi:hypothetical protein BFP72_15675 [Reichenbachiella sp. 5M10]|uniref:mechanosensitive ion channel family protein n=1 Tax=Reichenbachiella sp. 5M10 TaxID=1889772 RepID=UPI000C15EC2A|nr:mechanosensitive ion channel family protein [Reichenbachiella sp. 5M10]PIB36737.1 hypothetical protein BFP72_15675 [Reichenbachiella sp. 5M10]